MYELSKTTYDKVSVFPAFTSYIEICWSSISHYCVFWALFNPTTHNVLKHTLKVLQHLLKYIQYINVCDHFVDNKCFWVNCRCFCFSSDKYLVQMRPNGTLLHDLSHDYLITWSIFDRHWSISDNKACTTVSQHKHLHIFVHFFCFDLNEI